MFRTTTLATMLAAAALLAFASPALAVSGAGAIALEFPIGGRYNALGEAGTALSQDATAMWWNPGAFAFATDHHNGRAHAMQSKLVPDLADDIALYWGGYATRKWGGSLGFNITYLSMGEQEGTDDNGNPTGTFKSNMWAFGMVYGTRISQNVGAGLGVKFFRDNLAPDDLTQDGTGGSGSTFAVDAGLLTKVQSWKFSTIPVVGTVLWKAPMKVPGLKAIWPLQWLDPQFGGTNLGLSVSNLGPDITHVDSDQSDPLPRKVTLGMAYGVYHSQAMSLLLVGDMLVPLLSWDDANDDYGFGMDFDEKEFGAGVEWEYDGSLFVRFGWKEGTGEISGETYGFGMNLGKWLGQNIEFSYASVPQAQGLSSVNRFSIGYDF